MERSAGRKQTLAEIFDVYHMVELKRDLNKAVGCKGIQLVTISRPTAYGEYAPYRFVDTEQEFQTIVKGLRP